MQESCFSLCDDLSSSGEEEEEDKGEEDKRSSYCDQFIRQVKVVIVL